LEGEISGEDQLGVAAEFRATIRQHAQQRNVEAIEEWNDAVIEQIGRG
jgi:hypothetical protein